MGKIIYHKQTTSDKVAVSLIKKAAKMSLINDRSKVDFKLIFTNKLSDNYNFHKNIVQDKIVISGIDVETIYKRNSRNKFALVYLHGGAYVLDYNDTYRKTIKKLLGFKKDMQVFAPRYSLAPKHPYPKALNECLDLYKYLLRKGFIPKNIMFAGDSAGGGLALALGLYLKDNNLPLPKAMIVMSPWTDFAATGESYEKNKYKDPMFGEGTVPLDRKAYAGENDFKDPYISPKYGNYSHFSNLLMFVGGDELIESDTLDIAKKCDTAVAHDFAGMFHVFPLGFNKMTSSRVAWKLMKQFIRDQFKEKFSVEQVGKFEDWFKLDNSGKIFPEVSNQRETNVFRVQIALTEDVEEKILQMAADGILERYPMFKVKLKHGLFWSYLDYNTNPFYIQKMPHQVCGYINQRENNGYLFKVFYRNNIIAIEMFHSLADGAGAYMLLKSLVFEYLQLTDKKVFPDNMVLTKLQKPSKEEYEDANAKFYNAKNRKHIPEKRAYRIKGTPLPDNNTGLISGTLDTKEILQLARSKNATVTEYLTALMMHTIYITQIKYREHLKSNQAPVKIFVPVNLRKHFPSLTLRNFSNFVKTNLVMTKSDITFEELLELTKKQFREGMTKAELIRKMSENVAFEKNFFLRFTPYFLKKYALKIGYNMLGMKLNTMSFTNIGKIEFPESMQPFIRDVTAAVYSGKFNTLNCAIVSYLDKFKITFTRSIIETKIEREFFRHFTDLGMKVHIESNYVEEFL